MHHLLEMRTLWDEMEDGCLKVGLGSHPESTLSDTALNETPGVGSSKENPVNQEEVELQPLISHISAMDRGACMGHISTLHDEVEKIFETPPRFNIDSLSTGEVCQDQHRFGEDDYKNHRRMSFPHVHHPLKSMTSRSFKSMKGIKRKVKKKFQGARSFPSKIAAQSPVIPEVDVEEYQEDIDSDDADFDMASNMYSIEMQDSQSDIPELAVGFYIGESERGPDVASLQTSFEDSPLLMRHQPSIESYASSKSVAAQKFHRQASGSPEPTSMFEIDEAPRPSEQAAHPRLSLDETDAMRGSQPSLKVNFQLGEEEPSQEDVLWVKRTDVDTGKGGLMKQSSSAASAPSFRHKTPEKSPASDKKEKSSDKEGKSHKHKHGHHHHEHHHGHHHGHHHRHHEHFRMQDLLMRRQAGSEIDLDEKLHRVPTESEEALTLQKADLDQMASHRWGDVRGIRRHKIAKHSAIASVVHLSKTEKLKKKILKPKKKFDHSPHELFVELDELHVGDQNDWDWEWREKARWIKFEEDVEEGAERWGKPHVASLSFHSLIELRKGLEQGVFLLDLESTDLKSIAHNIVEQMDIYDLIQPEDKGNVLRTLLLKHNHVQQRSELSTPILGGNRHVTRERSLMKTLSSASFTSASSVTNLTRAGHRGSNAVPNLHDQSSHNVHTPTGLTDMSGSKLPETSVGEYTKLEMAKVDIDNNMSGNAHIPLISPELQKRRVQDILKRIPIGSEATTVMVGCVDFLQKPAMAFVRLSEGQIIKNFTEVPLPTRFVSVLLGPDNGEMDYHEVGRSLSTLMSNQNFHDVAYQAESREEFLHAINDFLTESIVLPPGDWDHKTLLPIMDMARKRANLRLRKKQKQMEKEAEKTNGLMGVTETVLSTSLCGLIFGLFSGQPLMILGATGPVLVYEQSLYKFCESNDLEFLPMRCWIGFWVTVIAAVVVALEGSFLVKFVTRFTEEIFAILISLIFIYEVIKKLTDIYQKYPLIADCESCCPNIVLPSFNSSNSLEPVSEIPYTLFNSSMGATADQAHMTTESGVEENLKGQNRYTKNSNQPNTALLSTILALGTFFIAYFLRIFRNSKFLGRSARRALGDFGILIALVVMVLLDVLIKDTCTQKLEVSDEFAPTAPSKRGWFINPMGMKKTFEVWLIFASIIPAFLIFILLFMEVQITETIMDKKMRKGSGYHLDMMLVGVLVSICGLLGLPWMCAATVRSVAHKSALSVFSRTHAPGEKPKLLYVQEQRLTSILVSILIGSSLSWGPLFREIPLTVLFGVFLYLGVSSMSGVQMYERTKLLLMPVKHHPSVGYVRRVRTVRMHLYTLTQLSLLVVLWVVKSTEAALAFPFLLILLVPLRLKLLTFIFTEKELHELDKEEEDTEEEEDEPDFYQLAHMPI
ncbi:anion exchange protein 2-like isoform X1 [Octopus vulgaris]|uniref:Anion exchange protein n=1 Tax=Octopus vulgaris TaxID=6645 RepID=A0AA36AIJ6_OCTVU|nr:anion exchange protein 2-like isoform X1 [Octopus vulgaris]